MPNFSDKTALADSGAMKDTSLFQSGCQCVRPPQTDNGLWKRVGRNGSPIFPVSHKTPSQGYSYLLWLPSYGILPLLYVMRQ